MHSGQAFERRPGGRVSQAAQSFGNRQAHFARRVFQPSDEMRCRASLAEPAQRGLNGAELDQIVLESIKDRSKWDLFPKAADARILFGLVQTPGELAECPQLESRDFYREIDHPVMGKIKVPAVLFNFSLTPYEMRMPAPALGQHNQEVYGDGLDYSREDLTRLRRSGAI